MVYGVSSGTHSGSNTVIRELSPATLTNLVGTTAVTSSSSTADSGAISSFSAVLETSSSLEDIFQRAADTYGVPVNLLKAIAKAESNFNPNATSSAGAMGVMQLMPATAAGLGCTDPYDPEQNIMAGAKYISQMLSRYNGDVSLALAAYNAGPGNVDKYGGIPPFTETQNYVSKVLGYYTGGEVAVPSGTYGGSSVTTLSETESATASTVMEDMIETLKEQMVLNILQMQINKSDDDDDRNKLSFL